MGGGVTLFETIGYSLFVIAALELLLGFIVLTQNPRNSPVNKAVAAFSFFSCGYALFPAITYIRAVKGLDYDFFTRATWIGWLNIPAAFQFIFYLKDEKSRAARTVGLVLYPFWFIVLLLCLFTNLFETGVSSLIPYVSPDGPLENPARIFGALLILWIMFESYRLKREVSGIKKAQLDYFLTGILIFGGGATALAVFVQLYGNPGFDPSWGAFFGFPWVILTFYAIMRYSLFDIRLIISRSLSIVLLSLIFSIIQIVLFKLFKPTLGDALSILVTLPLVGFFFFGTPFRKRLQGSIQRLVLKGKYDYQGILKESIKAIVTKLDLDELLRFIIDIVKQSLEVENVSLLLKDREERYYMHHNVGIREAWIASNPLPSDLIQWVEEHGRIVVRQELEGRPGEEISGRLAAYMKEAVVELIVPLLYKGRLTGLLTLGKKGRTDRYVQGDIDLLEVLANHVAVAMENARLYEDARRVKESLLESESKFRTLSQTTAAGIFIHQGDKLLYANPAGEVMTGYTRDELLSLDFSAVIHPAYLELVRERSRARLRGEDPPQEYEFKIIRKDGEERWVIMSAGVIEYEGKPAIIGTVFDITERKSLEGKLRYAQKMEAMGKLAGGVAHDFNNILTTIAGYGSVLLAKMGKDDPLRDSVDQILSSSERAADLTRSLLAFGAKQDFNFKVEDLGDVARNMEKFLSGLMGENIELTMRIGDEPLPILADVNQLGRVLMNLVVNACDAMPNGGRLTVETCRRSLDGEFIRARGYGKMGPYSCVSVKDTGIGISKEIRDRIFEPFFTTKSRGKGTGFGLSIVYDIVKQHRGYVDVVSEPGKGSAFTVYLPMSTEKVEKAGPDAPAPVPSGQETILLAEDDDAVRTHTKAVLEGSGYRIIEAVDGKDAVNKFRLHQNAIHLLILDLLMPNMNGKEAYEAIRKIRPDTKTLFTSGYAKELFQKAGILGPEHDFILKPLSQQDLLKKTREILDA